MHVFFWKLQNQEKEASPNTMKDSMKGREVSARKGLKIPEWTNHKRRYLSLKAMGAYQINILKFFPTWTLSYH